MQEPNAYTTIISPRSRRLRTVGVVLLAGVLVMVLYGYFGLMPTLARSARKSVQEHSLTSPHLSPSPRQSSGTQLTRAQRLRKLQAAIGLAYWGVCGLLLLSAVFVAWLDLREISRQYLAERRAIWSQTSSRFESPDDPS